MAGGNTSLKRQDTLYVKGSGWDLATIEAAGFAPVDLQTLQQMATLSSLSDSEMVRQQKAAMRDPHAPNPSVEAILHAIIPFRYVDHTHADAVVTLSESPQGREALGALFPDFLIVPYVMPGFVLAKRIYEMSRDLEWQRCGGITFFSGLVMRWFRDAFCEVEKREAKQRGIDPYALLEEKARKVPVGAYGIIPIFSDSMKYDRWYHAVPSFLNLSLDPARCNRAAMFRALQENACIVSAINLQKIEAFSGVKADSIVFAGGAAKGILWPQILADVLGIAVRIPVVTEATALGAAMAPGVGAGIYGSLEEAARTLVSWDREYLPDMEHHAQYAQIRERWQEAYDRQLALVDAGITQAM